MKSQMCSPGPFTIHFSHTKRYVVNFSNFIEFNRTFLGAEMHKIESIIWCEASSVDGPQLVEWAKIRSTDMISMITSTRDEYIRS